jgi:tetratricopeptide (TPR) repeat protein
VAKAGSGGGSAGSGGYNFQARTIAFVASHVVGRARLDWIRDFDDLPLAIEAEVGGAGDDLRIEFHDSTIDVQVKRGLDLSGLREVVRAFCPALEAEPTRRLLVVVDDSSSQTIRQALAVDLRRIAQGRRDALRPITDKVIAEISAAGARDVYDVAGRIFVVELPLEQDGALSRKVALSLLREFVADDDERRAWDLLLGDGHRLQQERGRRDRRSLVQLLTAEKIALKEAAIVAPLTGELATPVLDQTLEATRPSGAHADPWHSRIDEAKKLIEGGHSRAAHRLLLQIQEESDKRSLPARVSYRLHANIGASLIEMGDLEAAQPALRKALDYEEGDSVARASLAQVLVALGETDDGVRQARRVLEKEPNSRAAWAALVQAVPEETEGQIPAQIREDLSILAAQGLSAYRRGNVEGAISLFRSALQKKRDPQVLLLLAKALWSVGATDDVVRYSDEAIEQLSKTDRVALLEDALLVRGAVESRMRRHTDARAFFERARALPGHSWKVESAIARNLLALHQAESALAVIESLKDAEAEEERLLLSAFAFGALGRSEKAKEALEALNSATNTSEGDEDSLLSLAEAALHAGLSDLAQATLDRLPAEASDFRAPLFRGRLAGERSDLDGARAHYLAALNAAPISHQDEVRFEYADLMRRAGDLGGAIALLDKSGIAGAPASIRRDYARMLYDTTQATKLDTFLSEERARRTDATWLLDLEARIALDREDWPRAIGLLEELRKRASEPWVSIKLAECLLREGKKERAAEILVEVTAAAADSDELMAAAHLLAEVARPVEALSAAYRAVRLEPDNPRLRLAYVKAFLDCEKGGHPGLKPSEVGADTWFRMKAVTGDESREYLIAGHGPVDIQRAELLSSDERAAKFIGLKVGERVVIHSGALAEREFEIAEVRSASVKMFQESLSQFGTWFPDHTGLQSFKVDTGSLGDFVPIFSNLQDRAKFVEEVLQEYEKEGWPLGTVASALGVSIRAAYASRSRSSRPVFVDPGDPAFRASALEASSRRGAVVLTATALTTALWLEELPLLVALFERRIIPQSLLDELEAERADIQEEYGRGGARMAWIEGRFVMQEPTKEWLDREVGEIDHLLAWARTRGERRPRPIATLTPAAAAARKAAGASSYDAIALAREEDALLLADDLGLLRLARGEGVTGTLATVTLLPLAQARGLVDEEWLARTARALIKLGHEFVPVWPELILQGLSQNGFSVDAETIRLFERLSYNRCDADAAVQVGVAVLKRVALSIAAPQLEPIAALCFEVITSGRPRQILRRLEAEIRQQCLLLPLESKRLLQALHSFVATKAISGS